jgi:predicted ATPase
MLTQARIRNFRCLRHVDVTFGPLTVLVGPNGAGKTSLLDLLNMQRPWGPHDVWQQKSDVVADVELEFDDRPGAGRTYQGGGWSDRDWRPHGYQLLRLDLASLRKSNQVREELRLAGDGQNIVNVFASFDRATQGAVAGEFCRLLGMFADVNARPSPSDNGYQRLVFQDAWDRSVWYETNEVSDGTMLFFAFTLLKFQRPGIELLAIEEPERGLHPYLLGELIGLLRALATPLNGEGPRSQVILATHSPELLEFVRPEEARFFRRQPQDGSVTIETAPTGSPEWQEAFKEYRESLGNAWLSGGLGGVPGH